LQRDFSKDQFVMSRQGIGVRRAREEDIPAIRAMHRESLRVLGAGQYTPDEIEGVFEAAETVDPGIVADGTFYLAERGGRIVGSAAWTRRRPGYEARLGTDARAVPDDAAIIRAVFVAPDHARQGIARALMDIAESDAVLRGAAVRLDLLATLSGIAFYRAAGYVPGAEANLPLPRGGVFRGLRMSKEILPEPWRALAA
jgi:GNAT superfamily N-acetyltransferase